MSAKVIVSELLLYAVTYSRRFSKERVTKDIINFYSSEAILEAKHQLWKSCEDIIEENLIIRRDTVDRLGDEQNVLDIIEALQKLENLGETPTILAENMYNFPPRPQEELLPKHVEERLASLEQRLAACELEVSFFPMEIQRNIDEEFQ